jgi:hypothetical protein
MGSLGSEAQPKGRRVMARERTSMTALRAVNPALEPEPAPRELPRDDEFVKLTLYLKRGYHRKLKVSASMQDKTMQDLLDEILKAHFDAHPI